MDPNYGFLMWVVIGALAGVLGSVITRGWKIALSDVVVGAAGAAICGAASSVMFRGSGTGLPGVFVALTGACLLLGVWVAVKRVPA